MDVESQQIRTEDDDGENTLKFEDDNGEFTSLHVILEKKIQGKADKPLTQSVFDNLKELITNKENMVNVIEKLLEGVKAIDKKLSSLPPEDILKTEENIALCRILSATSNIPREVLSAPGLDNTKVNDLLNRTRDIIKSCQDRILAYIFEPKEILKDIMHTFTLPTSSAPQEKSTSDNNSTNNHINRQIESVSEESENTKEEQAMRRRARRRRIIDPEDLNEPENTKEDLKDKQQQASPQPEPQQQMTTTASPKTEKMEEEIPKVTLKCVITCPLSPQSPTPETNNDGHSNGLPTQGPQASNPILRKKICQKMAKTLSEKYGFSKESGQTVAIRIEGLLRTFDPDMGEEYKAKVYVLMKLLKYCMISKHDLSHGGQKVIVDALTSEEIRRELMKKDELNLDHVAKGRSRSDCGN
jgi:hypothetical protein